MPTRSNPCRMKRLDLAALFGLLLVTFTPATGFRPPALTAAQETTPIDFPPARHLDRKQVEFAPGITAEFIYIDAPGVAPEGFMMGSPESEEGRLENERQFRAVLSGGYWLQTTPVTQAQWQAIMGSNPSQFTGTNGRAGGPAHPVEHVSWQDSINFIARLKAKGIEVRLPTEAEWEFACRAGSATAFAFGDDPSKLDAYAWHAGNSNRETHPVATKRANAWGLFDMYGNVLEWCHDWHGPYPEAGAVDPTGPPSGDRRVMRGGSSLYIPATLRSARRFFLNPTHTRGFYGLRLAMDGG